MTKRHLANVDTSSTNADSHRVVRNLKTYFTAFNVYRLRVQDLSRTSNNLQILVFLAFNFHSPMLHFKALNYQFVWSFRSEG